MQRCYTARTNDLRITISDHIKGEPLDYEPPKPNSNLDNNNNDNDDGINNRDELMDESKERKQQTSNVSDSTLVDVIASDPKDLDEIISRLPDFSQGETTTFNARESSLAVPLGTVIKKPFPPVPKHSKSVKRTTVGDDEEEEEEESVEPPKPVTKPLEIFNYNAYDYFTLCFNQPMIPVGPATLQVPAERATEQSSSKFPAKMVPEDEGTWRWTDTNTLRFTPTKRFRGSARYTVTVPKGTQALETDPEQGGGILQQDHIFTFDTSILIFDISVYGLTDNNIALNPLIVVKTGNDEILPDYTFSLTHLQQPGRIYGYDEIGITRVTDVTDLPQNIQNSINHRTASPYVTPNSKCWIAFRPTQPLMKGTLYRVMIESGSHSIEGGLEKGMDQMTFQTFQPLKFTSHYPSFYKEAQLGRAFTIDLNFNNDLDRNLFNASLITITPATIENLKIEMPARCDTITISGVSTLPSTVYKVSLSPNLTDIYGQPLGKGYLGTMLFGFSFKSASYVDKPQKLLQSNPNIQQQKIHVLDPWAIESEGKALYSCLTLNYTELHVQIYSVEPEHYWIWKSQGFDGVQKHLKTRKVEDKVLQISEVKRIREEDSNQNRSVYDEYETEKEAKYDYIDIDVTEALKKGFILSNRNKKTRRD